MKDINRCYKKANKKYFVELISWPKNKTKTTWKNYKKGIGNNNCQNNIYLTAIGLSPGGSGFKHILQVLDTVLLKFTSGGLNEKHVVASWKVGNRLSVCFQDTGKPRKKPVSRWSVAGPSGHWHLASGPASKVNTAVCTFQQHKVNNTQLKVNK